MSLEQNLHRGSRAKEVLENEVFIDAFDTIEKELTESWKKSPARDEAGREKLWQLQKELQHQQSLKDRAKDYLGMS